MRFRYKRQPVDQEGLERAKAELSMARLLEGYAEQSERIHEDLLRRNNLGPKIHKALGGQ